MKVAVCGLIFLALASCVVGQQCTGCYPGTAGPCKQSNNVCWAYTSGTTCPAGTTRCSGATPAPAPTPAPATPAPAPTPAPPATTAAPGTLLKGLYYWSWSASATIPSGTNVGIAFSGYVYPNDAISNSNNVKSRLPGTKYIALGGGNDAGRWDSAKLDSVISAINAGTFNNNGYSGLVFDVEEGDSGLGQKFLSAFAAAKSKALKVIVTVSHSAPYGVGDAASLMTSFFGSSNIDYISPQLYTTGTESVNDFTANTVQWSAYKTSKAKIAPSIVKANLYQSAVNYFSQQGITLYGYIQWAQS